MSGWAGLAVLVLGQIALSRCLASLPIVRTRLFVWPMSVSIHSVPRHCTRSLSLAGKAAILR